MTRCVNSAWVYLYLSKVKHIVLLHAASLQHKTIPDMCCSVRLHATVWPTQVNYDFVPLVTYYDKMH